MLREVVVEVQLDRFFFFVITCISLLKYNICEKEKGIKNQSSQYYWLTAECGDAVHQQGTGLNE